LFYHYAATVGQQQQTDYHSHIHNSAKNALQKGTDRLRALQQPAITATHTHTQYLVNRSIFLELLQVRLVCKVLLAGACCGGTFYRPDPHPITQPIASKHWMMTAMKDCQN